MFHGGGEHGLDLIRRFPNCCLNSIRRSTNLHLLEAAKYSSSAAMESFLSIFGSQSTFVVNLGETFGLISESDSESYLLRKDSNAADVL